jgi:hypothetical protein
VVHQIGIMETIYVRLLNEGTEVYRPVLASQVGPTVYLISSDQPYNIEDESWEFPPGSRVRVVAQSRDGEPRLIAVSPSL